MFGLKGTMLYSREAGCGLEDTGRDPTGEARFGYRAIQDAVKEAGIGGRATGAKKNIKLIPSILAANFFSIELSLWQRKHFGFGPAGPEYLSHIGNNFRVLIGQIFRFCDVAIKVVKLYFSAGL